MIFIVSNNRQYSDHRLYFVKAPPRFEKWFNDVLVPFINAEDQIHIPTIIAKSEHLEWRGRDQTCSPTDLAEHLCLSMGDYPPFPR
jgi:hypothetical protein